MDIFDHYLDLIELAQTPNIKLINQVRNLLMPPFSWRQSPEIRPAWWRKFWFRYGKITSAIISPLKVEAATDVLYRIPGVFLILWIELVAIVFSVLISVQTAGFVLPPSSNRISSAEAAWFEIFFWTIVIVVAPAHGHLLYRFFTNPKNPFFYRGGFFLVLLTALSIVFLFPSLFVQAPSLNLTRTTGDIPWTAILLAGGVGLFIFIPAISYLLFLSIDLILWFILILAGAWIYFLMFHESHPIRQIQRLVFERIPNRKDKKTRWKLTDLPEAELDAIRDWAEANREGTEKRLLPTILLFSLIQLFGWNAFVNTQVGQRLMALWNELISLMTTNPISFPSVLISVLIGFMVALFLIPFVAIGKLFVNILPQSLIIEACIVAKHQKQQAEPPAPEKDVRLPARFWDRVALVFGYERREDFS